MEKPEIFIHLTLEHETESGLENAAHVITRVRGSNKQVEMLLAVMLSKNPLFLLLIGGAIDRINEIENIDTIDLA